MSRASGKKRFYGGYVKGFALFACFCLIYGFLYYIANHFGVDAQRSVLVATIAAFLFLCICKKRINYLKAYGVVEPIPVVNVIIYFFDVNLFFVIPYFIYWIIKTISTYSGGGSGIGFFTILCRVLLAGVISFSYEKALRMFLFGTIHIRHLNQKMIKSLLLLDAAVSVLVIGGVLSIALNADLCLWDWLTITAMEAYCGISFWGKEWVGSEIYPENIFFLSQSQRNRFIFNLMLFGPVCIYDNARVLPTFNNVWIIVLAAYCIIRFSVEKREGLVSNIKKMLKDMNLDATRIATGAPTMDGKRSGFEKGIYSVKKEMEDSKLGRYIFLSFIFAGIGFAGQFLISKYVFPDYVRTSYIANFGNDLIMTLISSTFLIVSFLSFLGDKEDKILWDDMRTYRLVSPLIFNFVGITVFTFASLLLSAICFYLQYDFLFLASFVVCILFLVYLTFLVIMSFFQRKKTLEDMKKVFFYNITDYAAIRKFCENIYHNSLLLIAEKKYDKLRENIDFYMEVFYAMENLEFQKNAQIALDSNSKDVAEKDENGSISAKKVVFTGKDENMYIDIVSWVAKDYDGSFIVNDIIKYIKSLLLKIVKEEDSSADIVIPMLLRKYKKSNRIKFDKANSFDERKLEKKGFGPWKEKWSVWTFEISFCPNSDIVIRHKLEKNESEEELKKMTQTLYDSYMGNFEMAYGRLMKVIDELPIEIPDSEWEEYGVNRQFIL